MKPRHFLCFVLLFVSLAAFAQQTPDIVTAQQSLQAWRKTTAPRLLDDWGQLARYRDANLKVDAPRLGEDRVVFFGDSITDGWDLAGYFPGKPFLNRGISGQTTSQMLVRFRQDVIELKPRLVVILAGTNDIAGNTGPIPIEDIERNYASFADLARANGIRVAFASVMPVSNYTPRSALFFPLRSPDKIIALNRWLKQYCEANRLIYVDYFSAMTDAQGLLRRELSEDGLHPNAAGYKIMAHIADAAIDEAFKSR